MEFLLEWGADADIGGKCERTALHRACQGGFTSCVRLLLEHDANIDARDFLERTPLMLACIYIKGTEVIRLLCEDGANLELTDTWGNTALHHAALGGHLETLKVLLQHKCEVDAMNHDGYLPVHYASLIGRSKNVEFLLEQEENENGALPDIPNGVKTVTWADYEDSKYDDDPDLSYDSTDSPVPAPANYTRDNRVYSIDAAVAELPYSLGLFSHTLE